MTTIRITNWDKWQSYRRDRGTPPWIKVHRNLMSNADWASLTDAEKGQLVCIWIVAADRGGQVPSNPAMLRKICQLDDEPNINKFIELGFMTPDGSHGDAKVTTKRRQRDAPETETETETETDKKECSSNDIFEKWWKEVPKKVGKGGARRAFKGALKKTTFENLLTKIQEYSTGCADKKSEFIAHPDTWLNKERWLDETFEGKGNGINRRPDGGGGRATKDERGKAALLRGLEVKLPEPPQ